MGGNILSTYIPDGFDVVNVENLSGQIFLISFENQNGEYLIFKGNDRKIQNRTLIQKMRKYTIQRFMEILLWFR